MPNGTIIRDEIEKLAVELEFKAGYQRVATPHIAKSSLYDQTGHLAHYRESMYPPMEVLEETPEGETVRESYMLKPMNCPHHHKIFASRLRSYRSCRCALRSTARSTGGRLRARCRGCCGCECSP